MQTGVSELLEQGQRFCTRHRIEAIQWLIENKNLRSVRDRLRQPNALPHPFAISSNLAVGRFQ